MRAQTRTLTSAAVMDGLKKAADGTERDASFGRQCRVGLWAQDFSRI